MFVLRAKAKLTDATAEVESWALLGPGSDEALIAAGIAVPTATWSAARHDGLLAARLLPAGMARAMLVARPGALPAAIARLPQVAAGAWWWSEAAAAVPTVFAATQEKFVPQMLNFEVLGGVNFRKGCYPGQEVVARSQYLGKLRRRMQVAHADAAEPPAAGSDVYHSSDAQPVGTVVMSAAAPGGGVAVLVEVSTPPHDPRRRHADADARRCERRALVCLLPGAGHRVARRGALDAAPAGGGQRCRDTTGTARRRSHADLDGGLRERA